MNPKKILSLLLIATLCFTAIGCGNSAANDASSNASSTETANDIASTETGLPIDQLIPITYVYAVDGDTIVMTFQNDSTEYKLSLIGVTIPIIAGEEEKSMTYNDEAAKFIDNKLKDIKQLYVSFDKVSYEESGDLNGYVWLSNDVDTNDKNDIATKSLNGILLSEGQAFHDVFEFNHTYDDTFANLSEKAKGNNKGFWQNEDFQNLANIYCPESNSVETTEEPTDETATDTN